MASRATYMLLFAKAQIVLGLLTMVVLAVLYPQRQSEVAAYARAPVCAPNAVDVKDCRRMVTAQVVHVDCPKDFRKLDSCQLELQINNRTTFLRLLREPSGRFAPGSQLRLELLGNSPTAAEIDGQLVREYGSPETALHTLRQAALVQVILTMIAAAYLLWRRRRATTS